MKIIKSYKFKLKNLNQVVSKNLDTTLELCRELYNAGLQERRDAWKLNKVSVTCFDQINQLVEIKEVRSDLKSVYSQVLQDVLKRLDKTFKAFYNRVKKGVRAGFPRFKSKNSYDSFVYPQTGFSLKGNKLTLSKIGDVALRLSRKMVGKVKTLMLKKEITGWFVIFTIETESEPFTKTNKQIGIDVGIKSFAVFNTGETIKNPKFFETNQKLFRRLQRNVSRKKKGSNSRRKAILRLKKFHRRITNLRNEFLHQVTTELIKQFDVICIEKLNIKGLANGFLAKQVNDVSWAKFFSLLKYKAENADKKVIEVNPNGTTQICSDCFENVPKDLTVKTHLCKNCGLVLDRDTNAARNILRLGLSLLASTKAVGL